VTRRLSLASIMAVMAILSVERVGACEWAGPPVRSVNSNFVVTVTAGGKPMAGVSVEIYQPGQRPVRREPVVSALTDSRGTAGFQGLTRGYYRVFTKHVGMGGEPGALRVVDDGSGQSTVNLRWPWHGIVEVRKVSGVFGKGKGQEPLAGANVTLTEVGSGLLVRSTSTDNIGKFALDPVSPGLYVLHVAEPDKERVRYPIEGSIAVEVAPNAENPELPRFGLIRACNFIGYKDDGSVVVF
jgi:hypothetical protein